MSEQPAGQHPDQHPAAPDHELEVLEDDETVPPRPEEDAADALRAEPDPR